HTHTHCLTLTHTHTLSHSLTHSLTHTHSLTLTVLHSLTHTRSLTLTHTLTHTHTHTDRSFFKPCLKTLLSPKGWSEISVFLGGPKLIYPQISFYQTDPWSTLALIVLDKEETAGICQTRLTGS